MMDQKKGKAYGTDEHKAGRFEESEDRKNLSTRQRLERVLEEKNLESSRWDHEGFKVIGKVKCEE